tara:strand:+ start:8069 stop:9289 length:1221 start_codon:yes stop_codon:yes gene_type:complete
MNALNENISPNEAKCLSLLSFEFLNYMRLMTTEKGKYFHSVENELLALVRDEAPNVDAEYSKFEKLSQKKEFLKELLLEYLVGAFVDNYKKRNRTIDDFIADHEKSAKKYSEGTPDVAKKIKKCLENPKQFEPSFHYDVESASTSVRSPPPPVDTTAALQEKRKLTKKPSSETSLRDWFGRKGAPGKKGGWVDCNTCRKGKCKPCGRSKGEKRSKYPKCRPTPAACKGFKKPKKAKKEELSMDLDQIIMQELSSVIDEKKKKKKKGKKDACYHKVKARYKVWPSAYASGALSKCRKVGAKNWGNSKKESLQIMIEDELSQVLSEKKKKPCKPSKGKRFAKRVNGKCRSFGQAGKAKSGGDRIRPGTKKGDAYCARSAKIKKCKNPPCANDLSRKKWKCRGSKSMKE